MRVKALLASMTAILLIALAAFTVSLPTAHAASAQKIDQNVQKTLANFRHEVRDANEVLSKAKGLLIFPSVYQGGIVFGGQYGEGALLMGGKVVDYYNLVAGSYGFQLGGQKKSVILAFMNDAALENFRSSSGWSVGADASVALVKIGAEGGIDAATLNKPIIAFVIGQKGLMYNLSLEGSKISKLKK